MSLISVAVETAPIAAHPPLSEVRKGGVAIMDILNAKISCTATSEFQLLMDKVSKYVNELTIFNLLHPLIWFERCNSL